MTTFDEIKEIFSIKRIIASLLAALMMFSSVVKSGKLGKVELVVTGEVTTQSEKINLEIISYSLKEIDYSEEYTIEVKKDGEWEEIERGPIKDIAIVPSPMFFQSSNVSVDIRYLPGGKLEAGEYRITKMIRVGRGSNFEPYTAYFTVTEAPAQEVTTVPAA